MLYIGKKVGKEKARKLILRWIRWRAQLDSQRHAEYAGRGCHGRGGSLLNAPDAYMDKIALGGNYPDDIVDLDATPEENVKAVAKAKGVGLS